MRESWRVLNLFVVNPLQLRSKPSENILQCDLLCIAVGFFEKQTCRSIGCSLAIPEIDDVLLGIMNQCLRVPGVARHMWAGVDEDDNSHQAVVPYYGASTVAWQT